MDFASSGASDEVLLQWVTEMWWGCWSRQARVNYVGMWKHRFEREAKKAAKTMEVEKEKDAGIGAESGE